MSIHVPAHKVFLSITIASMLCSLPPLAVNGEERQIPEVLKPWESWVTWDDLHRDCPTVYHNAEEHLCFWPAKLSLAVDEQRGVWALGVTVFGEAWVPLPGSGAIWPTRVEANGEAVVVAERDASPAVQLPPGQYKLTGEFQWDAMPQRVTVPREIGILDLSVAGQAVAFPTWDADGQVWLKRERVEAAEQDLLAVQIYRLIEDGIPTWLLTDIEITVSGKSREVELGHILPAGFKLETIASPLPVAVDDGGRMKAQVRAGKWTVATRAFRTTNVTAIGFPGDAQPVAKQELIGFRANPAFRLAAIDGLETIDVTQTSFPERWRQLPVYQWDTGATFQLVERMRGTGQQSPLGLKIDRRLWLDEDGSGLTYQDRITGQMQQIWRLDATAGQELGAVRIAGDGQLITTNPQNGLQGVEIRSRNVNLEAIGRVGRLAKLPATGWQADADSLGMTFVLPPGWRAFAIFGADAVQGDWLTAWSLLDLFLLLLFSLAVFRMWGVKAGIVAFLAFGLAYHELGSPRLTWLFLLMPIALLQVIPEGTARQWVTAWKYLAVALLVVNLVPFLARQIQTTIYPQLERPGFHYAPRGMLGTLGTVYRRASRVADLAYESRELVEASPGETQVMSRFQTSNLKYDPHTRIQTGPAEPQWSWNLVYCRWEGPVTARQTIRPILISMTAHRACNVLRIVLLITLGAVLVGARKSWLPRWSRSAAVVATLLLVGSHSAALRGEEIPSETMLNTLRQRLLEPTDAYPAADIASVDLKLEENRVTMTAEIHTTIDVAVPLPGRLPVWSPLSVNVGNRPAELVRRKDDYLWLVLPKGVHQVTVTSMLPDASDWEWTYILAPHRVSITAPGWNVAGVGPNGVPEQQVFFTRQLPDTASKAAYDRKDFNALVAIDRYLEVGLIWQVRTEATRLSGPGKAVSLMVPLIPGEHVLTSNAIVEGDRISVRLGAGSEKLSWESELPVGADIQLSTGDADAWVERWHLVASPAWNVLHSGLTPVFESQDANLIPVWHPWPGEAVSLSFRRPQPVSGENITVRQVDQTLTLGSRQRTTELKVQLESSIGGDFLLDIAKEATVSSLQLDEQTIPVRREDDKLIITLHPGRQSFQVDWKTSELMATFVDSGNVTLPVEGANITSTIQVPPDSRWVLWAAGPRMGPAVRFWTILVSAILIALVLGSVSASPLRRTEWVLLAIGLTQVHISAAMIVVGWLFLLTYRGRQNAATARPLWFNLRQIVIVFLTLLALGVIVVVVGTGLLGNPEMFIVGNHSTRTALRWFQPRTGLSLPVVRIVSVSVWYYRLLMLFWALWLASALLRWLKWGWTQFSRGGCWKRSTRKAVLLSSP